MPDNVMKNLFNSLQFVYLPQREQSVGATLRTFKRGSQSIFRAQNYLSVI